MSKAGIVFLSASNLTHLIRTIENKLPGYWYSVSQEKDNIRISIGPSEYCLLDTDRAWAMTKEGDNGRLIDISTVGVDDQFDPTPRFLETVVEIESIRQSIAESNDGELPRYKGPHRHQSKDDLSKFKKAYARFLSELNDLESRGEVINELYVGSCQLSVDCSIRGTDRDGKAFDYSCDFTEDAILSHSLLTAVVDYKVAFLHGELNETVCN